MSAIGKKQTCCDGRRKSVIGGKAEDADLGFCPFMTQLRHWQRELSASAIITYGDQQLSEKEGSECIITPQLQRPLQRLRAH